MFFLSSSFENAKKKSEAMNGMIVFAPCCMCECVISAMTHRALVNTSLFHRTFKLQFYDLFIFIFIFIFAFVYHIVAEFSSHQIKRNHAQNSHVDQVELSAICVRIL